jgi:hypothetical protein
VFGEEYDATKCNHRKNERHAIFNIGISRIRFEALPLLNAFMIISYVGTQSFIDQE